MKKVKLIFLISPILLFSFILKGQSYDLLIKNGHLIDSKNNIDQVMDVAISQGKIAAVKKNISALCLVPKINSKGTIRRFTMPKMCFSALFLGPEIQRQGNTSLIYPSTMNHFFEKKINVFGSHQ